MKVPISCLVVIYCQSKVLILERADRPGFWQSVTGSLELGENLQQTALRELFEETGFQGKDGCFKNMYWANQYFIDPYWRFRYAPYIHCNTEHVFSFELSACLSPLLADQEHTGFEWVEWQEAVKKVFSPSNQMAIEWIYELKNT